MNQVLTRWKGLRLLLVVTLLMTSFAWAQESKPFKPEELDQMLAPIALYPDSLLSQVLMAATYPAEVAEAAAWSKAHPDQKGDAAVKAVADKPWDPSVQSLEAFPQVLATMAEKPEWVQQVGDAFLAQPEDVMNSAQRLRAAAKKSGNLETTAQQKVIVEQAPQTQQTIIKIEPANPQVVYVPAYNPTVVYGTWWYPSYPPVYLPPPPGYVFGTALISGIAFGIGIGITNSLWGGCNWGRGNVDINVNRYNNINVNRKLNVNQNNVNWNHNAQNRRGVPYRDAQSRERFGKQVAGADSRQDFRGRESQRDVSRERAQAAMKDRGLDPAKGREKLRSDPQTRERAQAAANNMDRDKMRAATQNIDRDKMSSAAQNIDRDKARSAAKNIDRDRARQSVQNRGGDSAFSGIRNSDRAKQDFNRGTASRQAAHRPSGGAHARGGGRGHR
ncbi:MAG: DUF3300 domain-containing protein [Desulfobacterales bacterium]